MEKSGNISDISDISDRSDRLAFLGCEKWYFLTERNEMINPIYQIETIDYL